MYYLTCKEACLKVPVSFEWHSKLSDSSLQLADIMKMKQDKHLYVRHSFIRGLHLFAWSAIITVDYIHGLPWYCHIMSSKLNKVALTAHGLCSQVQATEAAIAETGYHNHNITHPENHVFFPGTAHLAFTPLAERCAFISPFLESPHPLSSRHRS